MIGKQERWQEELFVAGPLSSLIPEDHILKRVDHVLRKTRDSHLLMTGDGSQRPVTVPNKP